MKRELGLYKGNAVSSKDRRPDGSKEGRDNNAAAQNHFDRLMERWERTEVPDGRALTRFGKGVPGLYDHASGSCSNTFFHLCSSLPATFCFSIDNHTFNHH